MRSGAVLKECAVSFSYCRGAPCHFLSIECACPLPHRMPDARTLAPLPDGANQLASTDLPAANRTALKLLRSARYSAWGYARSRCSVQSGGVTSLASVVQLADPTAWVVPLRKCVYRKTTFSVAGSRVKLRAKMLRIHI